MRRLFSVSLVVGLCLLPGMAWACPMCAETVNSDPNLPRAFMYSILFMLAMPPLIFSVIAFAIWRAFRRHARALAALQAPVEPAGMDGLPTPL